MDLYRDFSDHYDLIFPVDRPTVAFLSKSFRKGRVLDLGCATGGHVLALRALGYRADGIDLDERMVDIARKKALQAGSPATFGASDIRSLSSVSLYEGVYCIGNTLVHLSSEAEIGVMIRRMYSSLVDGGSAVVQIVNYDRILDQRITALPPIKNQGRTFTRNYVLEDGRVRFQTRLTYEDQVYEADTPLFPLRARSLERMMRDAGFTNVVLYGGFDGRPFDPATSFALIAKGTK
ncbi:MAG: class I SAM-dependent methyltransferase [Candidatus Izemoplasmatales bacterium]